MSVKKNFASQKELVFKGVITTVETLASIVVTKSSFLKFFMMTEHK